MELHSGKTEPNCVKRLAETVPVAVGTHQTFVTDRDFLASGSQLPTFLGVPEIDIGLPKIKCIPQGFVILA